MGMEGEEGGDGLPVCRSALPRDPFISFSLSLLRARALSLALARFLSSALACSFAYRLADAFTPEAAPWRVPALTV